MGTTATIKKKTFEKYVFDLSWMARHQQICESRNHRNILNIRSAAENEGKQWDAWTRQCTH